MKYDNPLPTVDLLMEHYDGEKEGLVVIRRKNEPFKNYVALPGGFVESDGSIIQNAAREGLEEVGLRFVAYQNNPFMELSEPGRDERGPVNSVVIIGRGYGKIDHGSDADGAWVATDQMLLEYERNKIIAFDHPKPIKKYLLYKGSMSEKKRFGRVGLVGRFKPLHGGAAYLLEELCSQSEEVVIGLGSANRELSVRNPWTAQESRAMIDAYLSERFDNYSFAFIDDFGHKQEFSDGSRWAREVREKLGALDVFVSGNEYTQKLLSDTYDVRSPEEVIRQDKVNIRGSVVRYEMAAGNRWQGYVPPVVADYLETNGLVDRFREQFGDQTLEELADVAAQESAAAERERILSDSR